MKFRGADMIYQIGKFAVTFKRFLKGLLCLHLFASPFLNCATANGQQHQVISPVAPISPTKVSQCVKLQSEWDRYESYLNSAHEGCLNEHRSQRSQKTTDEPPETCSIRACQYLHLQLYSARSVAFVQIASCRQQVQRKLHEEAERTMEQDAANEAARGEEREAADNEARHKYGDWEERHSSWQVRQDRRKQQIEQLESEAANIPVEDERHSELTKSLAEIARIKAEMKQDPEPKQPQPKK